ncbi:MAG TPA: 23S rRNA (adenine(2503)-C(2))-methyltransferase RlmN [Bacteroidales bacterium]|nr:23S rRNA (adenine(2503)-C(2))-methyltransferase RlmN [Bacteroidales bacterium]
MKEKKCLLGMTLAELTDVVVELKLPKFTAKQIADWIYVKRVTEIDDMTNISIRNRDMLKERFEVGVSLPIQTQVSIDGTEKLLFKTNEGRLIESVLIPDDERLTLCISSQVGCKMNCDFCMTGKMGFGANLSVNEILNQVYSSPNSEALTNIVFMGMGEPLDNYENVIKAIEILTADYGLAWSPRRITLSTIGVTPMLERFLEESQCHLAVSLHSPISEQRQSIMPIEKKYPIEEVIELLKKYDWSKQRRLSFEYIMFDDVNDSLIYARELVKLLSDITCRVNLIRFHAIPGSLLKTASDDAMVRFRDFLTSKGIISTIRASRGEDISAACGMLSTEKQNELKNSAK